MDTILVFVALVFVVFCLVVWCYYVYVEKPNAKMEEKKATRAREQQILDRLRYEVYENLGVELDTVHERTSCDEIVRIVNHAAVEVAKHCVKNPGDSVTFYKRAWSEKRKLALQICPELADRLPHFSEFEPLKSYREEHILEKKAKQATA